MKGITFLASAQFIIVVAALIFIYFLFIRKHHWYSLKIPVVSIGSISLNLILKSLYDRPRPLLPLVETSGLSFPSGHAMVSFSFYGLLIYLAWVSLENRWQKWIVISFLLILIHLIGFSRIYLQVHYATDVLAGFAMGTVWLILSIFVLKKIEKFSARKIHPEESFMKSE
jgi:undecaprenyl-diphosphatase